MNATPLQIVQRLASMQGGTLEQAVSNFRRMSGLMQDEAIARMIVECPNATTINTFIRVREEMKAQKAAERRAQIVEYCQKYAPGIVPAYGQPHTATDSNGRRVVIVGSEVAGVGFVLRGIVRERSKGRPFHWLTNGQASTGAVQVAHIGEADTVPVS